VDIDILQLPIPDWDLECPRCRYPLRGLPSHRCPECGDELDMAHLVQPWVRIRPPRFTGRERPVPDFGLACVACRAPLAGAVESQCAVCGRAFELERLRPPHPWYPLNQSSCVPLPLAILITLFADEHVPFIPFDERSARELVTGTIWPAYVRVASEFYFEVLWMIRRERDGFTRARLNRTPPWRCANCGETNPGHFDLCWNCEVLRETAPQP
jgi:hypothetical protein